MTITDLHKREEMLEVQRKTSGIRSVFAVPNDEEGQEFLRLARKFVRSGDFKLHVRGRHSKRTAVTKGAGVVMNSHHDIPVSLSEWFGVYVRAKGKGI